MSRLYQFVLTIQCSRFWFCDINIGILCNLLHERCSIVLHCICGPQSKYSVLCLIPWLFLTLCSCPYPDCSGHGHCSPVNGSCSCDQVSAQLCVCGNPGINYGNFFKFDMEYLHIVNVWSTKNSSYMKEILSSIQCHTFFLIRKWSIVALSIGIWVYYATYCMSAVA